MLQNYSELLNLLEDDKISREDTYSALMAKEQNVLDAASRIATQEKSKTSQNAYFLNLSLTEIVARFAYTWQNIFTETIIDKRFSELPMILFQNERKFYVGIMMFIIGIFLIISKV